MSAIIQRHGGIVERYIGDEIMAIFGVPKLTRTTRFGRYGRPLK